MSTRDMTHPLRIAAEAKRRKALELRLKGHSIKAIAEAIGVSPPRVHKYLMDLFERYQAPPEEVEMYRRLELERLDRATMLAMRKIEEGDLAGIDRLVRIIDLRMRILGAYNIQQVRADLPIRLLWPEEVEA